MPDREAIMTQTGKDVTIQKYFFINKWSEAPVQSPLTDASKSENQKRKTTGCECLETQPRAAELL